MLSRSASPSKELMRRLKENFRPKSPNKMSSSRSRTNHKSSRSTHGSRDSSVDSQTDRSATLPRSWSKQRMRSKSTISLNSNVGQSSKTSRTRSMSRPSTPEIKRDDCTIKVNSEGSPVHHPSPRRYRRPSNFSFPTRIPVPEFYSKIGRAHV